MRMAAREVGDGNLRKSVFALVGDVVAAEEIGVIEHHIGAMRNLFLPVRALRSVHGRFHQPEVSAGVIHPDVKELPVVIGIVLDVLPARFDQLPLGAWLISSNIARLTCRMASRNEKQVAFAARSKYFHAETGVFLFIDEIARYSTTNYVPIKPVLPLG